MTIQEKSQRFIEDLYEVGGASMVGLFFKNVDIEWYVKNLLHIESSSNIVLGSFDWDETPEGHNSWSSIYKKLVSLKNTNQQL